MTRKIYPYSLDRNDAKVAGVCSTLGKRSRDRPDVHSRRLRRRAAADADADQPGARHLCDAWDVLAIQKKREVTPRGRMSDFDRMDDVVRRKPTVHAMRTELDVNDRRLMAIDHHLNTQNDELAREIEALRQEEK